MVLPCITSILGSFCVLLFEICFGLFLFVVFFCFLFLGGMAQGFFRP